MGDTTTNTETETATAKPKKAPKPKINYPFPSKREILESQAHDDVVVEHLGILYRAQTEDERETKDTIYKNRRGFMSSHAVNGTKLAEKVLFGEELTPEDWDMARKIVSRYGRQLAAHYREDMISRNPELAEIAKIFSAG